MLILGIESATPVASVALADENGLLGELTLNIGLTHSEQLLPMLDQLLQQSRHSLKEISCLGISTGPGSFTGLRIGLATAKALAQGAGIPLLAVPTLEAMAWQQMGVPGLISPMQNARRNQIYGALYRWTKPIAGLEGASGLETLIPATAATPQQWSALLEAYHQPVNLSGDGAHVYQDIWRTQLGDQARILPAFLGLARGSFVALNAGQRFLAGEQQDLYSIKPLYIRGI